jgi:branched-chain amino acid transport system substrate-binding protein
MKIALVQALTGPTASLGIDGQRGVLIAADDKKGQILGHAIDVINIDETTGGAVCGSGPGGTAAAQRIAADKSIVGVIGTSCSGDMVPAMPILSAAGYTVISGSNTSPFLTTVDGKTAAENYKPGYFRTAHNDTFQGGAAADCAFNTLGVTKAATINDGDPYTVGLAQAFENKFKANGGQVVDSAAVSKTQTDMHAVLTEIASKGAQLVYMPIFEPAGDFLAKQEKDVSGLSHTALQGADGLLSDTFVGSKGGTFAVPEVHDTPPAPKGKARGMYFSGPTVPTSGAYDSFLKKYLDRFGEAPIQAFHAHYYDAFNIMAAAIEKVAQKQSDGSLFIDRKKLRDAVAATKNFQGLTGTLSCNQFGDCGAPRIAVFQAGAAQKDLTAVKKNQICAPPA